MSIRWLQKSIQQQFGQSQASKNSLRYGKFKRFKFLKSFRFPIYEYSNLKYSIFQKPYACQIIGCTKRYTDPSSLRKHVKNHNARDQTQSRRKSSRDCSTLTLMNLPLTSKQRRYSESSVCTYSSETPTPTPTSTSQNNFVFDDVFNEENQQDAVGSENEIINTMNFNEMSDCIVTIQNNHSEESEQQQEFKLNSVIDNDEEVHGDEFVSFECVKKLLGEQNMDYIESAIQSQIGIDYFTEVV